MVVVVVVVVVLLLLHGRAVAPPAALIVACKYKEQRAPALGLQSSVDGGDTSVQQLQP